MSQVGVFQWDGSSLGPEDEPCIVFWRYQPPPTAQKLRSTFVLENTTQDILAYHFEAEECYKVTPNNGILRPGLPKYIHVSIPLRASRKKRKDSLYFFVHGVDCCRLNRNFWDDNLTTAAVGRIRVSFHQGQKGRSYFKSMPRHRDYPNVKMPQFPTCLCDNDPLSVVPIKKPRTPPTTRPPRPQVKECQSTPDLRPDTDCPAPKKRRARSQESRRRNVRSCSGGSGKTKRSRSSRKKTKKRRTRSKSASCAGSRKRGGSGAGRKKARASKSCTQLVPPTDNDEETGEEESEPASSVRRPREKLSFGPSRSKCGRYDRNDPATGCRCVGTRSEASSTGSRASEPKPCRPRVARKKVNLSFVDERTACGRSKQTADCMQRKGAKCGAITSTPEEVQKARASCATRSRGRSPNVRPRKSKSSVVSRIVKKAASPSQKRTRSATPGPKTAEACNVTPKKKTRKTSRSTSREAERKKRTTPASCETKRKDRSATLSSCETKSKKRTATSSECDNQRKKKEAKSFCDKKTPSANHACQGGWEDGRCVTSSQQCTPTGCGDDNDDKTFVFYHC